MKEALFLALRGVFIGIANAIPGVSGGTIAVITGIYDRLIAAVSGFFKRGEGGWKANLAFLAPIALGVGVGLVGFSFVIVWARATVPVQTSLFFAGLIIGSIPYVAKLANRDGFKYSYLLPFIVGFGLLVFLALSNRAPETEAIRNLDLGNSLWFFFCSVLGMAAMVVPGISGSFVLLLLGAYNTFITAIKEFNIPVLFVFGLGCIVGLLVISRLLEIILKKFHGYSYWGILGLVAGSIFDVIWRAFRPESVAVSTQALGILSLPVAIAVTLAAIILAVVFSSEKKQGARV